MKLSKEKKYVILGLAVLLLLLWWTRFQVFHSGKVSYLLDRWSGDVDAYWLYKDETPIYYRVRSAWETLKKKEKSPATTSGRWVLEPETKNIGPATPSRGGLSGYSDEDAAAGWEVVGQYDAFRGASNRPHTEDIGPAVGESLKKKDAK